MRRLTLLLLALLIALWAETTARAENAVLRDAVILYLLAAAVFTHAARPFAPWPPLGPRDRWRKEGLLVTVTGALVGLIALAGFWARRDVYTGWPFFLWLLGTPLFLLGTYLADRGEPLPNPRPPRPSFGLRVALNRRSELLLLALILLAALFLRTWRLDQMPNGCQSDECNNALDALRWLSGEPYTPYAGTNEGQATLFTYIIALIFKVLGPGIVTLRLAPVLMGLLTLLAFYTLARWYFDSPRLALVLTGLFAASRWHITFSRIVYELIMVPLVISLLLLALLRALRHGRRLDWALVGVLLALGMNTYTAFRVVPAWMALFFLYWLLGDLVHPERRAQLWRDVEGMTLAGIGAVIAIAPLGVYTVRHWGQFISRIRHISVFNDVERVGSYEPVRQNLVKALKMFNVQGDMAALNNLPGAPLLDVVVGALFVLGILYALRYFNRPVPFLYITGILFQLSTVVLSVAHEAPSARRPIGILVIVFLLVGEVLAQVWRAFDAAWKDLGQRAFQGVLSAVVLWSLATNGHAYFFKQAKRVDVWWAYSPHESAVGRYIRDLPDDPLLLVTRAYSHHSALRFIGGREVMPLNLSLHVPLREQVDREVIYILDPVLKRVVPLLQKVYPDGLYQVHTDPWGTPLFLSFRVPAGSMQQVRGLRARYHAGESTAAPLAFERRETALNLDFRQNPVLDTPFTVELSGALLVPSFGRYTFTLEATGRAELYLDENPVAQAEGDTAQVTQTLTGGFIPFRLIYSAYTDPGILRVTWQGPNQPATVLADPVLYAIDIGRNGLVGYYYPNMDWRDPPALIQRDLFILANNVLREPFSIRWVGKIAIPTDGLYRFATRSDDGSFVFIDGQMVVDNGGVHGGQLREGAIQLTQGFHDLEVRYFQEGGSREMTFFWTPPGRSRELVPIDYLFPIEGAELPQNLTLPPPPPVAPVVPSTEPQVVPAPAQPQPQPPEEAALPAPPVAEVTLPALEVTPAWVVGSCGQEKGQFNQPRGLAVSPLGRIYVADAGNRRVVVLNPDGSMARAFGEGGETPGRFVEPFEVEVAPDGTVWVLDAVRQLLLHFDADGTFLEEVTPTSPWYRPRGLDLAPDGAFWVADTGGVRVVRVGSDGALQTQIGGPDGPVGPGQPTDVAVAPDGTLYVVEAMVGLVWHLDAAGNPVSRWAIRPANTIDGPHVVVLPDGRVALTVPEEPGVHLYAGDGTPIGRWGGPETFTKPVGIGAAPSGDTLYVTDSHGCRVLAFQVADLFTVGACNSESRGASWPETSNC